MTDGHYTAQMDFFGKHNSGILTVKSTDSITKRMVFTTQTGFKIFDYKIEGDSVILIDCINPLKRNSVQKVLKADLRYLVAIKATDKLKIKLRDEITFITFYPVKGGRVLYKLYANQQTKTDEISIKHKGLPIKYKFASIQANLD